MNTPTKTTTTTTSLQDDAVHDIGTNSVREDAKTLTTTSLQYDVMLDFGINHGRTGQTTSTATQQYNVAHQKGIKSVGMESSTTRAGEEVQTHDVLSRRLDFQHLQQAAATQHRISRKDANVVRPF